jgi:signal transduction histidine kinase
MITDEMERDVQRLERITDRFSKIGSIPELKSADLSEVISRTVDYLSARAGRKVVVAFSAPETKGPHMALLNAPLFEWVLENLIRNGVDALDGEGSVVIRLESGANQHRIIVEDDGKGMGSGQQRSVFRPGFTTKKRGWGLGLTLAQRIVEQYHNGQISVQSSELGKGTRMLVRIPKA